MASIKNDKPNIIFILTDDQGYWSLGAYGNQEARTPNLDRIARMGWRFDNFFCVSPVCSPARASLLTGKIPSQHGIHDWLAAGDTTDTTLEPAGKGKVIEYLQDQIGYTDVLAENGYVCGISGKWHMGDSHHAQKGFSFWEVHSKGGGSYYNAPVIKEGKVAYEEKYITDAITDNALLFLDRQKQGDAPFYLSVHYTAPHSPWGREHHPEELYDDFHENCSFESVPDGLTPPEWATYLAIPVEDRDTRRNYLSGYYAAIAAMDKNVSRILDWLEKNDLLDTTMICFTSDNGMNMGHHGIYGKGNATFPMNMYEESVKVPFLLAHPGRLKAGQVSDALLSHYDFMPTLLEYVGLNTPDGESLPGRSFVDHIEEKNCSGNERVVVFDEYGPVRMIRDRNWKYVHRYPYGPNELYNLVEDPGETRNLVDAESCQEKVAEMRRFLRDWFREYVDPNVDGVMEPVTGIGQIGLAGSLGDGSPVFQSFSK